MRTTKRLTDEQIALHYQDEDALDKMINARLSEIEWEEQEYFNENN